MNKPIWGLVWQSKGWLNLSQILSHSTYYMFNKII